MSIGSSLAEARHQSGLTVTEVSRQTRIRESIIRDIEADDFSACGGDFYARGHIRSIATAIGLDSQPLISEYDAEHGPLGALRAADVFEPSTPIKIRERRSPSLSLIVAVVLLAIIGFSVYHLVSSRGGHPALAAARPSATVTDSASTSTRTLSPVLPQSKRLSKASPPPTLPAIPSANRWKHWRPQSWACSQRR